MPRRVLTPGDVREILTELVSRLADRGDQAVIHVIGGAAIALENPDRIATQDIDGYIRLTEAVFEEYYRGDGLKDEAVAWLRHALAQNASTTE